MHPRNASAVTKYERSTKVAVAIAKFVSRVSVLVHKGPYDATPDRRAKAFFLTRKKRAPKEPAERHQIRTLGSSYVCWVCGSAAATKENLLRKPCVKRDNQQHVLWALGDCVFCARCGARTSVRVRKLGRVCCGAPSSVSTARNLKSLRNGRIPGVPGWHGRPSPVPWAPSRAKGLPETCSPCIDPLASACFTPGLLGEDTSSTVTWLV